MVAEGDSIEELLVIGSEDEYGMFKSGAKYTCWNVCVTPTKLRFNSGHSNRKYDIGIINMLE